MTEVVTTNDVRSQMVAELSAEYAASDTPANEPEAPVEAASEPESEEEIAPDEAGESGEPETVAADEEVPDETAEQVDDEPVPVVDPPLYWSAENKDKFAALPPDLQEVLKTEWQNGERVTNQKMEEAAAARKAAEKEAKAFAEITERVSAATEAAERSFGDKWAGATPEFWAKLARENPENYTAYKAQFDADQFDLQQAKAAREDAARVQRDNWMKEQAEQLKTRIPPLADPKAGKQVSDRITQYMLDQGVPEQALSDIAAVGFEFAWKSMLWDEAQKAKPTPQKPIPSTLASKAAPASRVSTEQTQLRSLRSKAFAQGASRQDMVNLMVYEESMKNGGSR